MRTGSRRASLNIVLTPPCERVLPRKVVAIVNRLWPCKCPTTENQKRRESDWSAIIMVDEHIGGCALRRPTPNPRQENLTHPLPQC